MALHDLNESEINFKGLEELLENTYLKLDLDRPVEFYKTEYEEVIQRYRVRSLDDYLAVDRLGRGTPLQPSSREEVWEFFAEFLDEKKAENMADFNDYAYSLYDALQSGQLKEQYDAIIVDEAQDLPPIKLKLLKELVRTEKNNLLFLSDNNQRIYQLGSWKQDAGINIVGRTNYLTLNYRTTQQIRKYAEEQFTHSNLDSAYLEDYKSLFRGPEPEVKEFSDKNEQYHYVVEKINDLLAAEEIQPYQICIMTPSSDDFRKLIDILEYEGLESTILQKDVYPQVGNGVGISTLHGSKGLEFRTVIVVNYSEIEDKVVGDIPDEVYAKNKLKQLDCLKYVACTRAREELIILSIL